MPKREEVCENAPDSIVDFAVTFVVVLPFVMPGFARAQEDVVFVTDDRVGIGTSTPAELLHLVGPTGTDVALRIEGSEGGAAIEVDSTDATPALRTLIEMRNNGGVRWLINDKFQVRFNNNQFQFDNTTNARVECVIDGSGNLTCLGVKNFATIDPRDESRAIYYAALEGPEAATYYRGTARLMDGEAVIDLPGHFSAVTEEQGLTVLLTPLGAWGQLYVVEKSPERLVVRVADDQNDFAFDYLVQGIRRGYLDYQVERSALELTGRLQPASLASRRSQE